MVGEINYIQRIPLIKMDQTLWASNNANSDAESHTIRLPFSFQLPKDLPPSFKHVGVGYSGEITYSIQIVGQRAGLLQRNRRVGRVFPLMPAVGIQGVCAKVDLLAGWKGTWKTITSDSKIRRGLWGQQSKIEVEVSRLCMFARKPMADRLFSLVQNPRTRDFSYWRIDTLPFAYCHYNRSHGA
jgi:hypothetical protein